MQTSHLSFCQAYTTQNWSTAISAGSLSVLAANFALLAVPLLGAALVLGKRVGKTSETAEVTSNNSSETNTLLLYGVGAFIMAFTSSFVYSLIAGDKECVRMAAVDMFNAALFGLSALLAIMLIVRLILKSAGIVDPKSKYGLFVIATLLIASLEVSLASQGDLLIIQGSTNSFPGWSNVGGAVVLVIIVSTIAFLVHNEHLQWLHKFANRSLRWLILTSFLIYMFVDIGLFSTDFNHPVNGNHDLLGELAAWFNSIFFAVVATLMACTWPDSKKSGTNKLDTSYSVIIHIRSGSSSDTEN